MNYNEKLKDDQEILKYKNELKILEELKGKLQIEIKVENYKYEEVKKYLDYLKEKYENDEDELRKNTYNKELNNEIRELEYEIKNLGGDSFFDYIYNIFS